MASNNAFTLSGSNPNGTKTKAPGLLEQLGIKTTPKPVQSMTPVPPKPVSTPAYNAQGQPNYNTQKTSGMINTQKPVQPVAPVASANNDVRDQNGLLVNPVGAQYDRNTGKPLNQPQPVAQPTPTTTPTPAPVPYTPETPNVFGKIVTDLANTPTTNPEAAYYAGKIAELNQQEQEKYKNLETSGIDKALLTGESGVVARTAGGIRAGYEGAYNRILQQQQLKQQALQQAGSLASPVAYSPTLTPFSPVENKFVGDQTQMERAVGGANITSAQDLTQQRNQIQSVFNGAEANFALLVNTAKQGGVNDMTIPALNALQQAVGRGLASDSAVINFQNTLATVRSQYAQILGGGTATVDSNQRAEAAIPNNISLGALVSLEQQLKAEATNRVAGIDNQIKTLTNTTQPLKSTSYQAGTTNSTGELKWDGSKWVPNK